MKVEELRVGNLVLSSWWDAILPVKGIAGNGVLYGMKEETPDVAFSLIPLTKEWLVKLGFPNNDNTMDIFGQYTCYFERIDDKLYLCFDGTKEMILIEYVHEAQNVYYWNSGKQELNIKDNEQEIHKED